MTHYIPAFTMNGPDGTQLSICREWVDPQTFSTEPDCSGCRAAMAEDDRGLASLDEPDDVSQLPGGAQ